MIDINEIRQHFPIQLHSSPYYEYMLKEYFQFKMLDIIFDSQWGEKLSLIGGTNLRIIHNIERFSEDLDFDNFNISRDEFIGLTDSIIQKLQNEGIYVIADDKKKDLELKAFRRNLIFPELLYNQNLSGHREQKFLIRVESEAHYFKYGPDKPVIQKFNIFTQINATPTDILLSMKIGAVLDRQKGRDYYDCIYLMGKTAPNWDYLSEKFEVNSEEEMKKRILESCETVDFNKKSQDFEKLVFNQREAEKVRLFPEYIKQKSFD
jgi:predicted nucleotidyltransferase component of viral defense system